MGPGHGILHLPSAPKEAAGYFLSLCFSLECFCIPPSSMCFWFLALEERISDQVLHLVP